MSDCGCNSNGYTVTPVESVSSSLDNLITSLLGTLTKTITNGRAVWSTPCSPDDSLSAFPRNAGEGFVCYLLRIFADYFTPFLGVHVQANAYSKGSLVTSGNSVYLALFDVPANTLITDTYYWQEALTPPAGPTGPVGPSGAGSATNYANATKTGNYTATNTDAVIFVDPAALTTITIPAAASVDNGKWYKIKNRTGAFGVILARSGADTIDGGTSYNLTFANEAATLVSDGVSKWSVF